VSTLVVYADTSDGAMVAGDYAANAGGPASADYSAARSGTSSLAAYTTDTGISVGQVHTDASWWDDDLGETFYSEQFWVYESFLSFDTSALTSGATVSAAVLRVTSSGDVSTTDFDIQARLRDWGTSLTTADWVAGADLSGLTLLGSYATSSGFTANTGYDLSDTAMAANVNKTGTTRMLLCSSRTVGNTAPTGDEFVSTYSSDYTGTTRDPVLTVTYAAGATGPAWTTPADTVSMTTTPELKFTSPASAVAQHFYLQLDTANTFDSGNLRTLDSSTSQTSWDYWTGAAWAALPSTGLASGYAGNEIRYTVTSALSSATWYRRVRAGTLA